MKNFIHQFLIEHFPVQYNIVQHNRLHRKFGEHSYMANVKIPRTFNEKILRSKIALEHQKYSHLIDKELVKDWVKKKIDIKYVIDTLKVFKSAENITSQQLAYPCILKPTHSSGRVIILKSEESFNEEGVKEKVREWLKLNHYLISGEPQYKNLAPKIIAEPLLGKPGERLIDYKFFCFHGEPLYIQVDLERDKNHKRSFYDSNWCLTDIELKYPAYPEKIKKPENFNAMLSLASKLSQEFNFVRVDFYNIEGKIYFGEITFHPESGFGPFKTYQQDLMLGKLIN